MKYKELKDKKSEDLKKLLSEKYTELKDFQFGSSGSKNKNVKLGKNLKKDIARIKTALNTEK